MTDSRIEYPFLTQKKQFFEWLKTHAELYDIEIISENPLRFYNKNLGCYFWDREVKTFNRDGKNIHVFSLEDLYRNSNFMHVVDFGGIPDFTDCSAVSPQWLFIANRPHPFYLTSLMDREIFPIFFKHSKIHSPEHYCHLSRLDFHLLEDRRLSFAFKENKKKFKVTSRVYHCYIPHFFNECPIMCATQSDEEKRKSMMTGRPDACIEWIKYLTKRDTTGLIKYRLLNSVDAVGEMARLRYWVKITNDKEVQKTDGKVAFYKVGNYCEDCNRNNIWPYTKCTAFKNWYDLIKLHIGVYGSFLVSAFIDLCPTLLCIENV
ncbi:hypothetical protein RFI_24908 [Reticulomyxa filosa]|uniref:Uncharacterized protein n=1 Tax=Reticulomyxa filosa TaxID=46433 RepID=X6MF13_RETFI|nr:hypothetical protein RFI_24908 [Reticulomyxa filosa]|eukprot:ETO12464.1 hypothetical protein RFI_24908 [Reticulomyxa filosa]